MLVTRRWRPSTWSSDTYPWPHLEYGERGIWVETASSISILPIYTSSFRTKGFTIFSERYLLSLPLEGNNRTLIHYRFYYLEFNIYAKAIDSVNL